MRTVRDRPTLLQRFPNGVDRAELLPEADPRQRARLARRRRPWRRVNGTESRAIVMADLAHVLWAANQGCLGFHPWPYRASDPDDIDELRIDLDPSPGVTFEMVREAAAEVRDVPRRGRHHASFPKTTGNRGLHLYVRVEPGWDSFGTRQAAVSRRPGDGGAPARPDHRPVVEGGARRPGVHRLQPERPAQDGVRRVVRAGARRRPGVDAVPLGRAAGDPPRPPHDGHRAGPARRATAIRGRRSTTSRSRSSRSSPATEADLARGIPDAPWPPVYPKMPDEARRVNPSRARPDPD